tara:strand:+ start:240 stop:671 length:432 start_codon:yes stop_codon:yes gene_type:complete
MIKYNLLCKKCKLTFDSWFASSKEYDKIKNKKLINCHMCGSIRVEKNLMAPKLINKTSSFKDEKNNFYKYQKINKTINDYQKFIKTNFEYVGENFAYEARSIHYNHKKRNKGIYGNVSKKDLKDLNEEGIYTQLIPWFERENN